MTAAEQVQLTNFLKQHEIRLSPGTFVAAPPEDVKNPVTAPMDAGLLNAAYRPGSVLPFPVLKDARTGKAVDLVAFVDSQRGVVAPLEFSPNGNPKDGIGRQDGPGKTDPGKKQGADPNAEKNRKVRPEQLTEKVRNLPITQNVLKGKVKLGQPSIDDNSNSQFAMMALWVARKHDVPVERTMALVLERFHASQHGDGSWGYHFKGGGNPQTMTCVGLIGLAVGHGTAQETRAALASATKNMTVGMVPEDRSIQNGLKKLGTYLDNPGKGRKGASMVNLYLLWSVERVGVLYNLKTIGNKDWYGWGVEILLAHQKSNGSWFSSSYHGSSIPIDTSMALLFLKRVNFVQDLTDSLRLYMPVTDPEGTPVQRK
jgi:hypothetical protein